MVRRKHVLFGLVGGLVLGIGIAWAKLLHASIQITIAGIAGCEASRSDWKESSVEYFDRIASWEMLLARTYRIRERLFPRLTIEDSFTESTTPLHLLLSSAHGSPRVCETQILPLFHHYLESGVEVNAYDHYGITPLQEAVIYRKERFVELLLRYGADPNLTVKKPDLPIYEMSTMQMAEHFHAHSSDLELERIIRLMRNEI